MNKHNFLIFVLLTACSGSVTIPDNCPTMEPTPKDRVGNLEAKTNSKSKARMLMIDNGMAILGPWTREKTEPIQVHDIFYDPIHETEVVGANGKASIENPDLSEWASWFESPLVAIGDGEICTASLTDRAALIYHSTLPKISDDQVEQELQKTTPWLVVEVDMDCEAYLLVDTAAAPAIDEEIDDQLAELLGDGTELNDEVNDIFVERSTIGFTVTEETTLASVQEYATGCGVDEGTTTLLMIGKKKDGKWQAEKVAEVMGEDAWIIGARLKDQTIGSTETGFYINGKFTAVFPPLEPFIPPDCDEKDGPLKTPTAP